MNAIIQETLIRWKSTRKTKMTPSGWLSGNAPCCEYRGQNPDKRGRGGIKADDIQIAYNCFNCGFTATYQQGRNLYPKFIKLLHWLNFSESEIGQFKLAALKENFEGKESVALAPRKIAPVKIPDWELLSDNRTHPRHINFLKSRGFSASDYTFLCAGGTYQNRVIIPFISQDTFVGFTARSIFPHDKFRYIMKLESDFVFGMEWVKPHHQIVFLMEGPLDALSIHGLAVMHNEISDAQAEMICDLGKDVIVVPDLDKSGLDLKFDHGFIRTALDHDWKVSFPLWKYKDANEAFVEYGPLFVVKHLIDQSTSNETTIRVKQKLFFDRVK
ncbi:Uncharacterised protein [uncultured archaeon]|nr:Uncharacterised protein [uncultured archaeon]